MLLVIDVGNTNFVLGLYKKEKLVKCWRMTTGGNRTADETGIFIHGLFDAVGIDAGKVEAVIISSVVPDIMYSLTQGIRKYFNIEPMIVGVGMKTGIVIKRDDPKSVGSDRIVDLVAANEIYGGPAIVIDYGTANTFDVINEKSEFITGFITPGISSCGTEVHHCEKHGGQLSGRACAGAYRADEIYHRAAEGKAESAEYEGHCDRWFGKGD